MSKFNDRIAMYLANGWVLIACDEVNSVQVLVTPSAAYPQIVVFGGKRSKPLWRSSSAVVELSTFMYALLQIQFHYEHLVEAAKPHDVAVGEFFASSWGYDQTNVEFYQVIKLKGATMAEVREVAQMRCLAGDMSGACRPIKDQFKGDVMTVKISRVSDKPSIKIDSYNAYLVRGESIERSFSSYA